jgi:small glutamine-rich tetratricopeptide repeat-containing protein alpha
VPCPVLAPDADHRRHAHYTLGDYEAAADAYRRGLAVEPSSASLKSDLASAEARIPSAASGSRSPPPADDDGDDAVPAAAGLGGMAGMADMLRGMGGGAGGGMPDLSSILNNPQMMQAAQAMMANGGMERLMSNPSVANMVQFRARRSRHGKADACVQMNRMQSGGGMPNMSELMQDPELRNL